MKKLIIVCLLFLNFLLVGCAKKVEFTKTIYAFDSYININLYEGSIANVDDIVNIYNNINKLADPYNSYSEYNNIYKINNNIASGILSIDAPKEIYEMLGLVGDKLKDTIMLGAGTLTNLWKDAIKNKTLPSEDAINEIKENIKSAKYAYSLEDGKIIASSNLVRFDLGAVAKGYATGLVKAYLEENNISKYMIDCGQSTILLGTKYNNKGFNVGVSGTSDYVIRDLKNTSVGSASILERNFKVNDTVYHHIIDPSSAYPASTYDTVCLIGSNPAILDLLSTYLMIAPDNIDQLLDEYNISHYYIFKNGSLLKEGSK